MSPIKQAERIRYAYAECLALSRQHQRGFGNWLEQACEEAQKQERMHRAVSGGRWRVPARVAAQYFAVKWFLSERKRPASFADVCSLRPDVVLAHGAADCCPKAELRVLRKAYADILGFDYSEWVSR